MPGDINQRLQTRDQALTLDSCGGKKAPGHPLSILVLFLALASPCLLQLQLGCWHLFQRHLVFSNKSAGPEAGNAATLDEVNKGDAEEVAFGGSHRFTKQARN